MRMCNLVCEEHDGCLCLLYFLVVKQLLELFFSNAHAQAIGAIEYEDDGFHIRVVVLPQTSVPPLPAHVIDGEIDVILGELFHLKADRRSYFERFRLRNGRMR